MANTLSLMTNALRNAVSKQRIRYTENGFNLDLAYICENIIAMGYPAENIEGIYRNRIDDVYQFFEENHRDHYKIYNLCSERSYDINKFHCRVGVYPFDDHNPPTIELIQNFCDDVDRWLKADKKNVAAVHCKAGKGRTGTMICCYLLHSGFAKTAEDALGHYDEKRTKDRKGVTIPSQRRYVDYYSRLISSGIPYDRRTVQICEIKFSSPLLSHSQGSVNCSISSLQDPSKVDKCLHTFTIDFRKSQTIEINDRCIPLTGDVKIEVYHKVIRKKEKYFHFWFNTYFLCDESDCIGEGDDVKFIYKLSKYELDDAHKDKEHKVFPEDFKVQLVLKPVPSRCYLGDNEGSQNNHHVVMCDQHHHQALNNKNHNQHNSKKLSNHLVPTSINLQNTNIGPIMSESRSSATGGNFVLLSDVAGNNRNQSQTQNFQQSQYFNEDNSTNSCKNHCPHLHSHHYANQRNQNRRGQYRHNNDDDDDDGNDDNDDDEDVDDNNDDDYDQQDVPIKRPLQHHHRHHHHHHHHHQQQQQQQQQHQQLLHRDNSNDVNSLQHTPSVSPDVSRSSASSVTSSAASSVVGEDWESEIQQLEAKGKTTTTKSTKKEKIMNSSSNDIVVIDDMMATSATTTLSLSSTSSNIDDLMPNIITASTFMPPTTNASGGYFNQTGIFRIDKSSSNHSTTPLAPPPKTKTTATIFVDQSTNNRRQLNLPISAGVKILTKNFKGRPRREST